MFLSFNYLRSYAIPSSTTLGNLERGTTTGNAQLGPGPGAIPAMPCSLSAQTTHPQYSTSLAIPSMLSSAMQATSTTSAGAVGHHHMPHTALAPVAETQSGLYEPASNGSDNMTRLDGLEKTTGTAPALNHQNSDDLHFIPSTVARMGHTTTSPMITTYADMPSSTGMPQPLTQILKLRALRKARTNGDQKGFCDIFGRTFLQLLFRAEVCEPWIILVDCLCWLE